MPVVPLLARGFVEDLYHELYLAESQLVEAYDPARASLLVLHGQSEQEQEEYPLSTSNFSIALEERLRKPGISVPPKMVYKSYLFNLEPGVYSIKVLGSDGVWLDFDTVALDYWTTSVVQTGKTIASFNQPSI